MTFLTTLNDTCFFFLEFNFLFLLLLALITKKASSENSGRKSGFSGEMLRLKSFSRGLRLAPRYSAAKGRIFIERGKNCKVPCNSSTTLPQQQPEQSPKTDSQLVGMDRPQYVMLG
jgi:hypothetical protein